MLELGSPPACVHPLSWYSPARPAPRPSAGAVYSRGGLAEVGAPLRLPEGESLEGSDGLVLRLRSDEHPYTCVLRAAGGRLYTNRFGTREGYNTLRLPFNTFRPVNAEDPPLRPGEQGSPPSPPRRCLGLPLGYPSGCAVDFGPGDSSAACGGEPAPSPLLWKVQHA